MLFIILFCLLASTITFKITPTILGDPSANSDLQNAFVTIGVLYPEKQLKATDQIYIRGDNCNLTWKSGLPLKKNDTDSWATMLSCPTKQLIQIKFLVNDEDWQMGANEWFIVYDRSSIVFKPSFYPKINPIQDTDPIASKNLTHSRKCSIYLPPSYHDNPYRKYSVLFMHDGQNLFKDSEAAFGNAWKIQDTLNAMIGEGEIREVIVVGIWNTPDRNNEYTYSYDKEYKFGGKGEKYLDWIQYELTPLVKGWFEGRIYDNRFMIGGSSLGGLISCYAMYTRPTFFSTSICMSSSFWWNEEDFDNKILKDSTSYNPGTVVYLDSGDAGKSQDSKNQTLAVKAHFEKIGYRNNEEYRNIFYYLDKGGEHNEYYWGKRFNIPLKYLFNAKV